MIAEKILAGEKIYYRPRKDGKISGDERILNEVLVNQIYRRVRDGFDVTSGEKWLDLGANIGAFAILCKSKGAFSTCYEPEPDCFSVLQKNAPDFELLNSAVTASDAGSIPFFISNDQENHSRGTVLPVGRYVPSGFASNVYAGSLRKEKFNGVKMDIEGSEGPILDEWLLPITNKLVLEYHTSRDSSIANLGRRLDLIKSKFKQVRYPPEYDRALVSGEERIKTFFDRMIYAWDPR